MNQETNSTHKITDSHINILQTQTVVTEIHILIFLQIQTVVTEIHILIFLQIQTVVTETHINISTNSDSNHSRPSRESKGNKV